MRVVKINAKATLPTRATTGSAGLDLYACVEEPIEIKQGEKQCIPTGIALEIPEGYVGLVIGRSGLGTKHGIAMANGVGVIDSDYRGEIHVFLCNKGNERFVITPNQRIAQIVITAHWQGELEEVQALSQTTRGAGGFGSTGK